MTETTPRAPGRLALTFDDGPDPVYTPRVLDLLADYEAKATFFCLGRQLEAHPELARRIRADGHLLANHSWSHADLTKLPQHRVWDEIARTQEVLEAIAGAAPRWFRPPFGAVDETVRQTVRAQHLDLILWTVDSRDWTGLDHDGIVGEVVPRLLRPYEIILLHTGAHAPHTAVAVAELIRRGRRLGYEPATVADGPQNA